MSTPKVEFSKNYFLWNLIGRINVKRIQMAKSQKEEGREKLVGKWNKEKLCKKPTNQSIRASKKVIQKRRQDSRNVVGDQDEYVREVLRQEKEMREYKS